MNRATARLLSTLSLALALLASPRIIADGARGSQDVALRAAFVYNFAKFTEWPALPPAAPIRLCVVGAPDIAEAVLETVAGRNINGHALEVAQSPAPADWQACHLLFLAQEAAAQASARLTAIRSLPVLTVSDSKGFARSGGMVELYVESGRMRFAINVTLAERAGLRLSSRLIGLARVVQ